MIGILVPAYHAASSLPELFVELFRQVEPRDVLVVDDGSMDGTIELCHEAGVSCFSHLHNQGKGAALAQGYDIWASRGAEAVISLDADAQHDPVSIPDFKRVWEEGDTDLILGDRGLFKAAMPLDRRLSNLTSTWLINRKTGRKLLDSQCGYRLLSMRLWQQISPGSSRFEFESELLVQAAALRARIRHVPVQQRPAQVPSGIRRLADSWRFLQCLMKGRHGSL